MIGDAPTPRSLVLVADARERPARAQQLGGCAGLDDVPAVERDHTIRGGQLSKGVCDDCMEGKSVEICPQVQRLITQTVHGIQQRMDELAAKRTKRIGLLEVSPGLGADHRQRLSDQPGLE